MPANREGCYFKAPKLESVKGKTGPKAPYFVEMLNLKFRICFTISVFTPTKSSIALK